MFSRLIDRMINIFKKFGYRMMVLIGFLIIISSVALSFLFVPTKHFSILTSSVGSGIGVYLIKSYINRLNEINHRKEKDNIIKREELQKIANEQTRKIHNLELDKNRLENMKVDVNSINPILKLGLMELNLSLNDYKYKELSHRNIDSKSYMFGFIKTKPESWTHEYIGLINKQLKINYGIDLNSVYARYDDNNIIISGIKSEYQGVIKEDTKWLLKEIRVRHSKNNTVENYMVKQDDSRIADNIIEHEKEFKNRLEKGINSEANDKMIISMGQNVIQLLLSPLKKKVLFIEENIDDSQVLSLPKFILSQNEHLDKELTSINEKIKLLNQ